MVCATCIYIRPDLTANIINNYLGRRLSMWVLEYAFLS